MQELPELGDAPLKQGNQVNQEVAGFRAAMPPPAACAMTAGPTWP